MADGEDGASSGPRDKALNTPASGGRAQGETRGRLFNVQLPHTALAGLCPMNHQLLLQKQKTTDKMPQAQTFDSFKTFQSCPRSLSSIQNLAILSKAFLYFWNIFFFFPTGLCLFPGPTTPGCIKARFQNFPNFGEFIDLFTVPRDGGRKASQRPGWSQDCQRTV